MKKVTKLLSFLLIVLMVSTLFLSQPIIAETDLVDGRMPIEGELIISIDSD